MPVMNIQTNVGELENKSLTSLQLPARNSFGWYTHSKIHEKPSVRIYFLDWKLILTVILIITKHESIYQCMIPKTKGGTYTCHCHVMSEAAGFCFFFLDETIFNLSEYWYQKHTTSSEYHRVLISHESCLSSIQHPPLRLDIYLLFNLVFVSGSIMYLWIYLPIQYVWYEMAPLGGGRKKK